MDAFLLRKKESYSAWATWHWAPILNSLTVPEFPFSSSSRKGEEELTGEDARRLAEISRRILATRKDPEALLQEIRTGFAD